MSLTTYLSFVLISAAQVAAPGPSTVFLVNNSILFGRKRAIFALSGDLAAIALLASLSAAGVGGLLAANETVFTALRLAGVGYLLWLGSRHFRPVPAASDEATSSRIAGDAAGGKLWLQSFGIGISNPKAILFFAALFPQFVPPGHRYGGLAILVATFVATKLVVLGGYAIGARQIRKVFVRRGNAALGRRLTGGVFVLFGSVMAWSALA